MKKQIKSLLTLALSALLIAGCGNTNQGEKKTTEGKVKTGLAVISSASSSKDAGESDGLAQVDSTVVAVTVNDSGKIVKCYIDGVQTKINFTKEGKLITALDTKVSTKSELGTAYGMGKASSIGKEWSEQISALANYVEGKTIDEVKGISVNETGVPTDSELKSSVTIKIGGYISAIEKAVQNAKDLGASSSDKLGLGVKTNIEKSKDAGESDGTAQAYSSYVAVTFDINGKITSSIIDASQTDVKFSKEGKITSDKNEKYKTKNELGAGYGMAKASSIGKEWFEQADALSKYVVGKTSSEVSGIAVDQTTAPTGSDLKSSVTIKIGEYVECITKANANAK